MMGSQYDDIGSKYESFKALPTSMIEEASLKASIQPWLARFPHARVLDLACGTGYYSTRLLDWGAGYVLGVDSSSTMVDAAQDRLRRDKSYEGRVQFRVGDALELGRIEGQQEPFHIVVGIWLLNYAGDMSDMTGMYRTISANLREGGVFIGVTPPPVEAVDTYASYWTEVTSRHLAAEPALPSRVDYYERLESGQGWKTEIRSLADGARFSFRNFHLRKRIYEEAARRGGLGGKLEWKELVIPEEVVKARDEFSKMCVETRHMGVLVVEK
jgi:toxoflavin synthase